MKSQWKFGALMLLPAMLSADPAPASEMKGEVVSVDPVARTIRMKLDRTGREVNVLVTEHTPIDAGKVHRLDLNRLEPGSRLVIHDDVVAMDVMVQGELLGKVKEVQSSLDTIVVTEESSNQKHTLKVNDRTVFQKNRKVLKGFSLADLRVGSGVIVVHNQETASKVVIESEPMGMAAEFWDNFRHNLFKPLLLFFYAGFLVPFLGVKLDFPHVIYQGLTIYLLVAIGWHGGEELADLPVKTLGQAAGFMGIGFVSNFIVGIAAFLILKTFTRLRKIDAATVAGYYGSDSAGTFVTCVGVLTSAKIAYAAYMPVMLAVMEIPGCLVALFLVSRYRARGMDALGNLPEEPGYDPKARPLIHAHGDGHDHEDEASHERHLRHEEELALVDREKAELGNGSRPKSSGFMNPAMLHEVFLNPGLFLLAAGLVIGFVSRYQGHTVTEADDAVFLDLFQGFLCLFLLEMGMTAARKLKDLKTAGLPFILFGLLAPNVFALFGIGVAHGYSMAIGQPLELGTYVLFSVLSAAASYIAVPAVQRMAIPEASPTLPLAASLGLTFSYNVTIGIPIYIQIAKLVMQTFPVT